SEPLGLRAGLVGDVRPDQQLAAAPGQLLVHTVGELFERRVRRVPGDDEGEGVLTMAVEEIDRAVRLVGGGPLLHIDAVLAPAVGRPVVGPQVRSEERRVGRWWGVAE